MTDQVEQWICIEFCINLEYFPTETIGMIQKATVMGNWWLAASSQHACSCITSDAEFFAETSDHPGDAAPLQPRFGTVCDFWLFPKLKSPLKGKTFQTDHWWNSGIYDGAADGNWENRVRSQGTYFEGDWGIIVLCTMFLVSCIFFNECLCFSSYMAGYFLDSPCM